MFVAWPERHIDSSSISSPTCHEHSNLVRACAHETKRRITSRKMQICRQLCCMQAGSTSRCGGLASQLRNSDITANMHCSDKHAQRTGK